LHWQITPWLTLLLLMRHNILKKLSGIL